MSRRCIHQCSHSGASRYSHQRAQMRYVIVCDSCDAELRELATVNYEPRFEPRTGQRHGHSDPS